MCDDETISPAISYEIIIKFIGGMFLYFKYLVQDQEPNLDPDLDQDLKEHPYKYINYCQKILTISCVENNYKPEEYGDLLKIFYYFGKVNTIEFSENDFILSNMVPFFKSLFNMHPTIKIFIFSRNRLLPENPQPSDFENLKQCFMLMKNVEYLDLSATFNNLFDNEIDNVLHIIMTVFKSGLVSLKLDSNIIEENQAKYLIESLGLDIRHFSILDNIFIENPNFYLTIFMYISKIRLSSLNMLNPDDEPDADDEPDEPNVADAPDDARNNNDPSNEDIIQIEKLLDNNVSLVQFSSSSSVLNNVVNPYLQRNLKMFWKPEILYAFSNDFFKVLMAFLLANKSSDGNKPQLPIDICFKIFGFFQNEKFLDENFCL